VNLAALAFMKHYSSIELFVIYGIAFVALSLLGLMSNAILGARGWGVFGNAAVLGAGAFLGMVGHDRLVRWPDFLAFGFPEQVVLISCVALGMLVTLLGLASIKRWFS
jgi:hypothetical protein